MLTRECLMPGCPCARFAAVEPSSWSDVVWLAVIVLAVILAIGAVSGLLLSCAENVDPGVNSGASIATSSTSSTSAYGRRRQYPGGVGAAGVNYEPPCTNTTVPAIAACRQAP